MLIVCLFTVYKTLFKVSGIVINSWSTHNLYSDLMQGHRVSDKYKI
jgi:hypothetical protein